MTGNEADRGEDRRRQDRLVERVHDRAAASDAGEQGSEHRGEDGDAPDRQWIEPELTREGPGEEHHGDRGDRVGLEEVGRHARAVADVVPDIVRDHGGIARIVLGDAGLDLPHEVGADVGRLRVDAAAETGEDRDEGAAEREPDEVLDRRVGGVVEPVGEHPVVARHAEEPEPDDEEPRDRACPEGDVQRRLEPVARCLCRPHVGADGDVHADKAGGAGEHGPDEEPDGGAPAELVVEADQQERDDGDDRDRLVLPTEVRGRAFLHGAGDLLHPLVPRRLLEQPVREPDAPGDGDGCAEKREQDCVVSEKAQCFLPATEINAEFSQRARFLTHRRPARGTFVAKRLRETLLGRTRDSRRSRAPPGGRLTTERGTFESQLEPPTPETREARLRPQGGAHGEPWVPPCLLSGDRRRG